MAVRGLRIKSYYFMKCNSRYLSFRDRHLLPSFTLSNVLKTDFKRNNLGNTIFFITIIVGIVGIVINLISDLTRRGVDHR